MPSTAPPLASLITSALVGTTALLLAGLVAAHATVRPRVDETEHDPALGLRTLLVALGWAVGLIPTLAFFAHVATGHHVTLAWLLAISAIVLAIAAESLLRHGHVARLGPAILPLARLAAAWRGRWPVLVASAALGVLWLVRHDSSVPPSSCVGEAALCAIGQGPAGCDVLRQNIGDAQLGNSGVLAGFLVLFGSAGFRALFAIVGALLALGGWHLGEATAQALAVRHASSGARWRLSPAAGGWIGLGILALNPCVLAIPLLDENLLTLAMSAILLPIVLAPPVPWWTVGSLFGLVVAMRHPMLVALPALLVPALAGSRRVLAIARLLGGLVAATLVENLHHLMALGSLFRFEHNAQYPPLPYRVLGHSFRWEGMLGWPLHDTLVRTPHNPFPMLAMWPLWLADHLGLVLLGLVVVGAGYAFRLSRQHAWLWLLWWMPVYAGLALQEAWDYPNKMGILTIAFAPLAPWAVAGIGGLLARPWRTLPLLGGGIVAAHLGIAALAGWQVPADARYFERFQLEPVESQTHLARARARALAIDLWPDFSRIDRHGTVLSAANLAGLFSSAPLHGWGWHRGAIPPRGPAVVVELDLRQPPWHPALLRVTDAAPDLDLTTLQGLAVVPEVAVPWEPTPLTLAAALGPDLALIELGFRDFRRREAGCDPTRGFCHCRFFETLDRGAADRACRAVTIVRIDRPYLRIRVPAGGVSLFATVNPVGNLVDLWTGEIRADGVRLRGPFEFWHN